MIKNFWVWVLIGATTTVITVGVYYIKTTGQKPAQVEKIQRAKVVPETKSKLSAQASNNLDLSHTKPARVDSTGEEAVEVAEQTTNAFADEVVILDFEEDLVEIKGKTRKPKAATPARFNFELGFLSGFYAATPAFSVEFRFPLAYVVGPTTSALRLVTGFAQTENLSRRYLPIYVDTLFYFPPGYLTGVENYVGCGLNYVFLTTGRKTGSLGGQIFYGVQSEGFTGKVFGELGYGLLRTGFSPAQKGLTILLGYRKKLSF